MTDEQINPDELNLAITEHQMDRISELKKENDTLRSQLQTARDALKQVVNEGMYSMTAFNGDDDDELVVEISKSTILSAQQALAAGQEES